MPNLSVGRGLFLADLLAGAITPALRAGGQLSNPADLTRRLIFGGYPEPLARHFRDRDGQDVDLVMTLGARTWGIEVKATSTPGRCLPLIRQNGVTIPA